MQMRNKIAVERKICLKHIIKRIIALALAAALLAALTACGKDDTNEFVGAGTQNITANQPKIQSTDDYGFTLNDAAAAGFGIGTDTPDSIIARFGQPTSQDNQDYTSVTIANTEYPFGIFEFEGAPGTTPVLTYVQIFDTVNAPCGICFGQNVEQAANAVLADSGSGLMSGEALQQKYFYGSDAEGEAYGRYNMLEAEYITSEYSDVYSLEYRAAGAEQGRTVTFTAYFAEDYLLTNYTLRYQ